MEVIADADAVLASNEAFYRAFNQKNIDTMKDIWSVREDISCAHPGWNLLRGDDVIDSWRSILTNPDQPRIVAGGATVSFAGEAAVVVCREMVLGGYLLATNVFVYERSAWRLLHHQSGPVAQG